MNEYDTSFRERAQLADGRGFSPPVYRFAPRAGLADVVRRFWVPVWDLESGRESIQRVLQYPVCLIVIDADHASLVGPTSGLATKRLTGRGWAVGVMLQPAVGRQLIGADVSTLVDGRIALEDSALVEVPRLVADIRASMTHPDDPAARESAIAVMETALRKLAPVDPEGLAVNTIVRTVENDPTIRRVSQICERFGMNERALQRLAAKRIGLTPKWLIRRRRLHEASWQLSGEVALAELAASLGYSDQAHFQRDFQSATGITPTTYAKQRGSVPEKTRGEAEDPPQSGSERVP